MQYVSEGPEDMVFMSSTTRECVTKLDDFLNDLSEELAPSPEFISHANKVMDKLFNHLKVCLFIKINLLVNYITR